jgi:hypothetical protein
MKKCYEWMSFLGLVFAASLANAQQSDPPPMAPGFKQAMQDCAQSLGISPPGPSSQPPSKSDMQKLQNCLSGKGFSPPAGPPPSGGPGGPPPGGWSQEDSQSSHGSGQAQ